MATAATQRNSGWNDTMKAGIVASARALMGRQGWAATTIDAIAAEAGVAPQTIYAAFGNKRALLTGMRQVMLRDSQIPELMAAAAAESDARRPCPCGRS